MKLLLLALAFIGLAHGAQIDIASMGSDLNGWKGGVGRFSLSGCRFEVARPTTATDESGNLVVDTVIRERKGASPAFEGTLRVVISPDGLVREMSMEGSIDGHSFETGRTTRPEPVSAPTVVQGEEGGSEGSALDVTPVNPERSMRDGLGQSLRSAIERARSSEKVVKRDLSSWMFSSGASSSEQVSRGVDQVVQAVFRHSGR